MSKNEDQEEGTVLDDTEALLAKEVDRLHKAVAISSVKDALQQRVFPMFVQIVEAVKDLEERLDLELHGDDEENGEIDDIGDRLDAIENRLAMMAAGLEARLRLQGLARSVKTYAAETQANLVAEADDALEFLTKLDQAVADEMEKVREEEAKEGNEEPEAKPATEPIAAPAAPPA